MIDYGRVLIGIALIICVHISLDAIDASKVKEKNGFGTFTFKFHGVDDPSEYFFPKWKSTCYTGFVGLDETWHSHSFKRVECVIWSSKTFLENMDRLAKRRRKRSGFGVRGRKDKNYGLHDQDTNEPTEGHLTSHHVTWLAIVIWISISVVQLLMKLMACFNNIAFSGISRNGLQTQSQHQQRKKPLKTKRRLPRPCIRTYQRREPSGSNQLNLSVEKHDCEDTHKRHMESVLQSRLKKNSSTIKSKLVNQSICNAGTTQEDDPVDHEEAVGVQHSGVINESVKAEEVIPPQYCPEGMVANDTDLKLPTILAESRTHDGDSPLEVAEIEAANQSNNVIPARNESKVTFGSETFDEKMEGKSNEAVDIVDYRVNEDKANEQEREENKEDDTTQKEERVDSFQTSNDSKREYSYDWLHHTYTDAVEGTEYVDTDDGDDESHNSDDDIDSEEKKSNHDTDSINDDGDNIDAGYSDDDNSDDNSEEDHKFGTVGFDNDDKANIDADDSHSNSYDNDDSDAEYSDDGGCHDNSIDDGTFDAEYCEDDSSDGNNQQDDNFGIDQFDNDDNDNIDADDSYDDSLDDDDINAGYFEGSNHEDDNYDADYSDNDNPDGTNHHDDDFGIDQLDCDSIDNISAADSDGNSYDNDDIDTEYTDDDGCHDNSIDDDTFDAEYCDDDNSDDSNQQDDNFGIDQFDNDDNDNIDADDSHGNSYDDDDSDADYSDDERLHYSSVDDYNYDADYSEDDSSDANNQHDNNLNNHGPDNSNYDGVNNDMDGNGLSGDCENPDGMQGTENGTRNTSNFNNEPVREDSRSTITFFEIYKMRMKTIRQKFPQEGNLDKKYMLNYHLTPRVKFNDSVAMDEEARKIIQCNRLKHEQKSSVATNDNGSVSQKSSAAENDNGSVLEKSSAAENDNGSVLEKSSAEGNDNGSVLEKSSAAENDNGSVLEKSSAAENDNGSVLEKSSAEGNDNGSVLEKSPAAENDNGDILHKSSALENLKNSVTLYRPSSIPITKMESDLMNDIGIFSRNQNVRRICPLKAMQFWMS